MSKTVASMRREPRPPVWRSVVIAVVVIVATWPDAAWNFVWVLSIVLALLMPVLFFPFARDLWLAFDLIFRPHEAGDVHESQGPG